MLLMNMSVENKLNKKPLKPILGFDKFLLMALLKDGPLDLWRLKEKSILFISLIWYLQLPDKEQNFMDRLFFRMAELRSRVEDGRSSKAIHGTEAELEKLQYDKLIELNSENKYELTVEGKNKAKKYADELLKEAKSVDKELKPSSTAKNTTFLDAFLAVLKLGSGLVSGSVGLIADGTDATMDTVEAVLVWLGIKYHQENLSTYLVIIGLFVASITVGYDSVTHILSSLAGNAEPIGLPYLVIVVELIAILAAVFLFYYQRFVGKISNSLTLISQSVDSKNHIFIGLSVIAGAIFSIYGIYFVDAVIGLIIAVGIFIDSVGLMREAISAQRGESEDYSRKYNLPLEVCWEENKLIAFRSWILYLLSLGDPKNSAEIIKSLHKAFHPSNYIPILSELKATCYSEYDFKSKFKILIKPLKDDEFIVEELEMYRITEKGGEHLKHFIINFRYYDVHRSDEVLLAMARDERLND